MSNKAVIIDGVRSPIGTKGSPMIGMRSDEIAGQVIKGLLDRNKELDVNFCLLYTSPSPRDRQKSRMPSSA